MISPFTAQSSSDEITEESEHKRHRLHSTTPRSEARTKPARPAQAKVTSKKKEHRHQRRQVSLSDGMRSYGCSFQRRGWTSNTWREKKCQGTSCHQSSSRAAIPRRHTGIGHVVQRRKGQNQVLQDAILQEHGRPLIITTSWGLVQLVLRFRADGFRDKIRDDKASERHLRLFRMTLVLTRVRGDVVALVCWRQSSLDEHN